MSTEPSSVAPLEEPNPPEADEPAPISRREQRKRARIDRTRDAILEAAVATISRVGWEATTMDLVARQAGYSVGSLYNYFNSKEALILALALKLMREAVEAMQRPLPASLTVRQRLELITLRLLEQVESSRGWILSVAQQMNQPVAEGEELVPRELAGLRDATNAILSDEIRAAQAAGLVRKMDPQLAAVLFSSVLKGMVLEWVFYGGEGSPTELAPLIVKLTLDGIGTHEPTLPER